MESLLLRFILEYGATSTLGSSSAAVTCSAGQQCMPSVSLARGLVYYKRITSGMEGMQSSRPLWIEQIALP